MSYRFKIDEQVPDGIRRIAREELAIIRTEISRKHLYGANIHEARRHLKKLRALLNLVRDSVPKTFFAREEGVFRRIARKLSPARDTQVLINTIHKLERTTGTRVHSGLLRDLEDERLQQIQTVASRVRSLIAFLEAATRRVDRWPIQTLTEETECIGLEETYRKGRKAFKKAVKTGSPECFHRCRRHVKTLRLHFCLVEPVLRARKGRLLEQLDALDDHLGEDHDWVVLRERVSESGRAERKIDKCISKRRKRLEKRAVKIGAKIYKDKPRQFWKRHIRSTITS